MAPSLSTLYSLSFFLALSATLFVSATLRLLAILPNRQSQAKTLRKRPLATRVLIVLGSGGHTHEMFYLLRDLDTKKYTHRTYVVSSGDAFSAQRAAEFEKQLESREKLREQEDQRNTPQVTITNPDGIIARKRAASLSAPRQICVGPEHYTIATIPRARKIHQSLLTTPLSCLSTLLSALGTLLPLSRPPQLTVDVYEAAAFDLPDLIITNGPATAVIVVLASYILRFFNVRSAHSRGKCKTIYVESFARVKTLSLSGRILVRLVDRFLVQWESLEGKGGRAEYWGVLV